MPLLEVMDTTQYQVKETYLTYRIASLKTAVSNVTINHYIQITNVIVSIQLKNTNKCSINTLLIKIYI
ncbi:hypothetical protein XBO1_1300071 [Xenorhabdus bovienii str. oregonense]|uniref:Uncharacterized protein n=1 Tax=Xenorhabdus bovienii str. oregonense TaxID=1398202 RepID=A0A077NQU5_XENBV|nr:hypothetical protein XBO1_1300071 [Xenorhabdus bovienii str. oregonense]